MTFDSYEKIRLQLEIDPTNPVLLIGLEQWLQLGLINHKQVRHLSQTYLSCRLPVVKSTDLAKSLINDRPRTLATNQSSRPKSQQSPRTRKAKPSTPSLSPQLPPLFQSLKDELSVRWLLFLGVFLVVMSSAVLAASNWARFPAFLQYGVLWSYTMVFWGVGFWSSQKPDLKLTAQTLQTIAVLLVPINFWAMDEFGLWRSLPSLAMTAIGAGSLIFICWIKQQFAMEGQTNSRLLQTSRLYLITFFGLCLLHGGWDLPSVNIWAIYIAMVGTASVIRFLPQDDEAPPVEMLFKNLDRSAIGQGLVFFALVVLLVRGIFIERIAITQLGLAIGVCGWLVTDLNHTLKPKQWLIENVRPQIWQELSDRVPLAAGLWASKNRVAKPLSSNSKICQQLGMGLMVLGWLITVSEPSLVGQSVLICLLAVQFLTQKVRFYRDLRDVSALFVIGLVTCWLAKTFIPSTLSQGVLDVGVAVSGSNILPSSIYAIGFFPYGLLWVGITGWLYYHHKPKMAALGETLTLIFAIGLTLLGWLNPTWRSLNLILSTLTLGYVTHRRLTVLPGRVGLTHTYGLLTLGSLLHWFLPTPVKDFDGGLQWGLILITIAIGEWLVHSHGVNFLGDWMGKDLWQRSCWYFGNLCAGLSYYIFLILYFDYGFTERSVLWGCAWLMIPIALTYVAHHQTQGRRKDVAYYAAGMLIAAQVLTVHSLPSALIGWIVAMGLMIPITRYSRQIPTALLHIGFALALIITILTQYVHGLTAWYVPTAILILGLHLFHYWARRSKPPILKLYANAAKFWALGLTFLSFTALIINYGALILDRSMANLDSLIATPILGASLIYSYRDTKSSSVLYGCGWLVEFALATTIALGPYSFFMVAQGNLLLGVGMVLIARFAPWPQLNLYHTRSWREITIAYGLMALLWRIPHFNSYTGLITMGAGLIWIAVEKPTPTRRRNHSLINYSGLALITIGIYDRVVYEMLQSSGGNPVDALTIFSLVTAFIALTYRGIVWYCQRQEQPTFLTIAIPNLLLVAHLHWAIASLIKLFAVGMVANYFGPGDSSFFLKAIAVAVSACLGLYAIIQARSMDSDGDYGNDWWVYIGLMELAGTIFYGRLIWNNLGLLDPWRVVIVCGVALFIYQLPWQSWGWRLDPWHRTAIAIPALSILTLTGETSYLSLLAVALYYGRLAYTQQNIRWSYLSVGFIDWALFDWFGAQGMTSPVFYSSVLGLSLLYIAQFDTAFTQSKQRSTRHSLRTIAMGIICVPALVFEQDYGGIVPIAIGLTATLLGLGLQIRALLFVGTTTFILAASYQLLIVFLDYAFLKWVMGLMLGITIIFVAANFERSREQIILLMENWLDRLQQWQ